MIKKPDMKLPNKASWKDALKKGVDFISKLADQDDEQLAQAHQNEINSIITKHLLKVIVSDEPIDREIKQAIKFIIDEDPSLDVSQNEWVEVLKEALIKVEVQYTANEHDYLADVIVLYMDENLAGDKKPKAVKMRTQFTYDELPQELRNDIFEAQSQQQTLSIELYTKEQ